MSNRRVSQSFVHCILFLITYVLVFGAFTIGSSASNIRVFAGVLYCTVFFYFPVGVIVAVISIYLLSNSKGLDDQPCESASRPDDDVAE